MAEKAKKPLTAEVLAGLIWKGLNKDRWGDIDPYLFKYVSEPSDVPDGDDLKSLRKLLKVAVAKIKKEYTL